MKSKHETLAEGLSSIDPLAGKDLRQLAEDSGAEELLAEILASNPEQLGRGGTARPDRASRRPVGRRVLVGAAVAGVAGIALIDGLPGGGGKTQGTLPALARVAEAAAAQPPPDTALPYLYVKTRGIYLDTSVAGGQAWSVYQPEIDENWIAKDGSGRQRRVVAPAKFVGPEDRKAWEAAGRMNFLAYGWNGHTEDRRVPPGTFHDRLYGGVPLSQIPTDPTELSEWLMDQVTDPKADNGAGNGFSPAVRTLTLASDILNDPLATPELRAALYEAEGQIPGIEYLGEASDEIGRKGVAIGATSANSGAPTLYSLIFDPETSQVLATEEIVQKPPAGLPNEPTPLVTSATMFLGSGTTDSLTSTP